MKKRAYDKLLEKYKKIKLLGYTYGLLRWDQEVLMPKESIELRSQQNELISSLIQNELKSKDFASLLNKAKKEKLNNYEKRNIEEIDYSHKRIKRVPDKLIEEYSKVETLALQAWIEARKKSKYKIFKPHLKKIIELQRKISSHLDPKKEPYEVLFQEHERWFTLEEIKVIFENVKKELQPIIKQIQSKKQKKDVFSKIKLDDDTSYKIAREVSELQGINYDFARLDVSVHPFTVETPSIRMTTRYTDGLEFNILGTMHESGHGLYEQNLPKKWMFSPIGESVSIFVHESQSKIWENNVGGSKEFWKSYLPNLKKHIPKLNKISLDEVYGSMNRVKSSMIRVNADELTYPMHIILRLEIEEGLISGKIKVDDLPKEWNKRMKKYLGITPKNDSEGCLQDIHWVAGGFGYFPTYLMGCILASQLFEKADKDVKVRKSIEKGNFKPLLNWLIKNVHSKGSYYTSKELIKKATGKDLSSTDYINYLKKKYSEIYKL